MSEKDLKDAKENQSQIQIEKKHMLSLASVFGRAIVLPFFLKNNNFNLGDKEKEFVDSYIKYGLVIFVLFLLAV